MNVASLKDAVYYQYLVQYVDEAHRISRTTANLRQPSPLRLKAFIVLCAFLGRFYAQCGATFAFTEAACLPSESN